MGYTFVFPESTIIGPNSYLTAASEPAAFFALYGYDADIYGSIPRLNNSGDALILVNPDSIIIDQVGWEGGASRGLPDNWGSESSPRARRGESIVRSDLSTDSDTHADWIIAFNNGMPQVQQAILASNAVAHEAAHKTNLPSEKHSLAQNYPNPVQTHTTITFSLPVDDYASLVVYDVLGRQVAVLAEGYLSAGNHQVLFDATQLSDGLYLYRLSTGVYSEAHQLLVVR